VLPLPLSKKARAYLTANGFKPNDPAEWELDRVMDELGPRSSVLGELAESKARWFLSQLTGLKVDDENVWTKRFPPERLVELYCTYRDIPFVGRLCGLGISEARMRLKRLRSWVPKLDAIRPGHLASEINALLPAEARDYDILISRNVPWGLTLEALAEKHGITRERVRQLELRERGYAIERYNCAQRQLIALPAVANAIRRERQQLSRERFDEMVLSEWGSDEVSTNEHVDATTAVIHILAGAPDEPADDGPAFAEAARIVSELPEPTWLPIRERNEIDNVTIGTRRDIKRRAFNEGAVDVTRLQRSFRLGRRAIGLLLQELGLEPIDEEFYVPALKGNVRRVPVLTTTSKLLQAGGPMHIEDVQLGLNRHAQRLKFVTVAPNVLEKVLAHYGCRIEGGTVRAVPSEYVASIGGVERVFVDFVRRSGPVVSFWELYEEVVLRSAYSVPSLANALCKFSAIVAPVDAPGRVSLYTIRGVKPSEPDLLAAIDRQHQVSGTIDYEHTLDGVRVSFEAATWLLTSGVQVLPDIDIPEGDWTVFAERDGHAVSATVSNLFMYGLPHVVKALSVRKGDPMELELDFLRRQAVLRRGEGEGDE
jgi:hypothetical protein